MSTAKTMTSEEFEQVTRGLGIRPQSLKMARQVIVQGTSQVEVARANQISKSAISQLVKKIYAARAPAGFVVLSLPVPEALTGALGQFSELALQHQSRMQGEGAEAQAKALLLEVLRGETEQQRFVIKE
ncbi:TrfB-related DNA-binding protein [Aeromonas hydrophila]|uniref:TrfB-related DNA-binding protein n=1 Tax=Aeromonas hydrophila TaxID=644 RepID=UPI00235FBD77|nr:TrfB-related DNA-binding protein [Aeromonas hydrophila]